MNLESRINALDVEDNLVEAETLIDECFEVGFFPWDNPKFLVFLHWTILAYMTCRGSNMFMRGLVYARHIESLIPDSFDSDIYRDIVDWANLRYTRHFENRSSNWPSLFQNTFYLRLWQTAEYQANIALKMSLRSRVRALKKAS